MGPKRAAHLYQFSWVSTASPALSCSPKKPIACPVEISPLASGLSLVLSAVYCPLNVPEHGLGAYVDYAPTLLSRFLSHMSLIVHPAPRITSAPMPNRLRYVSGTVRGVCRA